jgi:phosphoribosylformylglycinamidine synthase subunit PurS
MRAKVYVTLKDGVLDPQGKAIHHAASTIGYPGIADIRQGKYFEIALAPSVGEAQAQAEIEKLAHEVLSNPVIENYEIELIPD